MTRQVVFDRVQWALAAVSFFTTAAGAHALLGAGGVGDIVSAVVFSGLVQVLVVVSAGEVPRVRPQLAWLVAVLLYVASASISSVFSVAYYFGKLSASDFSAAQFEEQRNVVRSAARAVASSMQDTAERLDALATYSEQSFSAEEAAGGTCRNSRGAGKGAAYAKRRWQAARTRSLAQDQRRRVERIGSALTQVDQAGTVAAGSVPDSRALREPWDMIRATVEASDVGSVVGPMVAWEQEGFPGGDPAFAEFAGRPNACQDAKTVALLQAVLEVRPPPMPALSFDQVDASDHKAVVLGLIRELIDRVAGLQPVPGQLRMLDRKFLPAIVLGFLFDAMLLGLSIFAAGARASFNKSRLVRMTAVVTDLIPTWTPFSEHRVVHDTMGEVQVLFRAICRALIIRQGTEAWLAVHKSEAAVELFGPAGARGDQLRDLLEEALCVLKREDIVRARPQALRDPPSTAALLAARLDVALGVVEGPDHRFEYYPLFGDLDALDEAVPATAPIRAYERAVDGGSSGGASRLLLSRGMPADAVMAARLLTAPVAAGYIVLRPEQLGMTRGVLEHWLQRHRFEAERRRLRPLRLRATDVTLARLRAIADERVDPEALRRRFGDATEARARVQRLIALARSQDLSEFPATPSHTPWSRLADELVAGAEALEGHHASPDDVAQAVAWALSAYMHAGELEVAQGLRHRWLDGPLDGLAPETRLLAQTLALAEAIDRFEADREEGPLRAEAARLEAALRDADAAEPASRAKAEGTLGRAADALGDGDAAVRWLEAALAGLATAEAHEVPRAQIYLAAALRRSRGIDPGALTRAVELLRDAEAALPSLASRSYARETRVYLLYEQARCAFAAGRDAEAIAGASEALRDCADRPWPTLGLLRVRAAARDRAGARATAQRDRLQMEAWIGRCAPLMATIGRRLLQDAREQRDTCFY